MSRKASDGSPFSVRRPVSNAAVERGAGAEPVAHAERPAALIGRLRRAFGLEQQVAMGNELQILSPNRSELRGPIGSLEVSTAAAVVEAERAEACAGRIARRTAHR